MQKYRTRPLSYTIHTKKDLNVRPEAIKVLEGNLGNTIFDIGLSNTLIDMSPEAKLNH